MMQSLSGSSILRCEDILIFLMPVADDSCDVSCSLFSRELQLSQCTAALYAIGSAITTACPCFR